MEDCVSSDEDYCYSSNRDSLDSLENEDSNLQWAPSKGPTTDVNSFSSISPFLDLVFACSLGSSLILQVEELLVVEFDRFFFPFYLKICPQISHFQQHQVNTPMPITLLFHLCFTKSHSNVSASTQTTPIIHIDM
ncbi:hypothetical protein Gotri_001232, partial [Gossypium trilobum]|nr:hypothetical protein [Gossypium trilobum]